MNTTAGEYVDVTVFKTEELGLGSFDDGRIQEIKPIPFPQEMGGSSRLGPLFYWAWASSANGDGVIPWHPHQGFEIVSYVLSGRLGHRDTLGTDREVSAGGLQAMQAGSGLEHREEIRAEGTDFLQIWFEPNLQESTQMKPTYHDFEDEDFTLVDHGHWTEKQIVGGSSPVELEAPVSLSHWNFKTEGKIEFALPEQRYWCALVVSGSVRVETKEQSRVVGDRSFIVLHSPVEATVSLHGLQADTQLILVQSPSKVDYPLYRM